MTDPRSALLNARRVVIKLGSRSLASHPELPKQLSAQLASLSQENRRFVIVSSGAIALGCARLGYRNRPQEMARLQAAAAAGQVELMHRYELALAPHGLTAAQVLLTHADLANRERLNNARDALAALLESGAIAIVNENDTVATDEIRFGDNDQLASMVVPLVGADLLILLTDVDGVLDPQGQRISLFSDQAKIGDHQQPDRVGSGGMRSKLDAAEKARRSGANVVIAPAAEPKVLQRIVAGEDLGTLFQRTVEVMRARQHWIAFTLRPRGTLLLDEGAVSALGRNKSLLPVGVLGVRGQFNPGDAVRLVARDGSEVGRGLTRLGALDLARAAGLRGPDLNALFGTTTGEWVVVHKDDLVLSK